MITNFTSGVILKGSDVEFIVVLTNKCDWDVFNNTTLNFYTTGSTSIEYPIGDTTSITQTVHLQGVELEALGDGVLRYTSTYQDGDGDHTVEMQTQFYLKTPIDYTPIDFASTEYVDEAIAGAVISGVTYSAGTNIDITNRVISVSGITSYTGINSSDVTTALGYTPLSAVPDTYATKQYVGDAVTGKQDTLISGTNIKTINNQSILGSGNIDIQGGSGSTYTAGANINISSQNVIAVTGIDTSHFVTSADVKTQVEAYDYATESQIPDVSNFVTSGQVSTQVEAYHYTTSADVQSQVTAVTTNKQDTLVSGENIKTINGESLLGSGNITITGGSGSTIYTAGDNINISDQNVIKVTGITSYTGINSSDVTTALGYTPLSAVPDTYATTTDVANAVSGKQDTIVAGNNIAINSNIVSVTGITSYPGYSAISGDVASQVEVYGYATTGYVQDAISGITGGTTYTAGDNIQITNQDVISVTGITSYPGYDAISGDVNNQITAATSGLQETLVSGSNIKTINNKTIVGSGNLNVGNIRGTSVTDVWTGTQAQYDAITAKSSTTLYFIV